MTAEVKEEGAPGAIAWRGEPVTVQATPAVSDEQQNSKARQCLPDKAERRGDKCSVVDSLAPCPISACLEDTPRKPPQRVPSHHQLVGVDAALRNSGLLTNYAQGCAGDGARAFWWCWGRPITRPALWVKGKVPYIGRRIDR